MEALGTYSDAVIWRCSFSSYSSGGAGIGGEALRRSLLPQKCGGASKGPEQILSNFAWRKIETGCIYYDSNCPDFAFNCEEPPPHRFAVSCAKSNLFAANCGLSRLCMFCGVV